MDKDNPILSKEPIIKRMLETKDYIVRGTGGYYWANSNHPGALIEVLSSEECSDLFRLESTGVLKKETKTIHF